MDRDEAVRCLKGLFALVLGAIVVFCLGGGCGAVLEQRKAIEAGVGRWVVDPRTGSTSFVYGDPRKPAASSK